MNKCPFCHFEDHKRIIAQSDRVVAVFDRYPVSPGHALIVPRRHVEDYFDLKHMEKEAIWNMVEVVKSLLDYVYKPDGYNIGINILREAGQTVPHAHVHLMSRYAGDVDNPRGGVRGVIPNRKDYTVDTINKNLKGEI